ncbi:LPXTG-site transpeptidase (sortase) family protein [Jiangella alkaliphila]|uniref:LPXTG-site transpeptidase (Sortase) family protein n=1 Tax=Jiangella alkaliphila TaxID=419479 RepID=A0A1H2L7Y3_9ACTN|nr:LPXTG-site transpeptidase (sortase) family protein [Jiangella alkaliphila]
MVLAGCADDGSGSAAGSAPSPAQPTPSTTQPPSTTPPATESPAPAETGPAEPAVPAALPASRPAVVEIESLGVRREVIDLGLTGDGSMEVPQGPDPIGWYDQSPTPGESGPSVLAGHLTWNGTDGVFRHLDQLAEGDEVVVTREDGTVARFAVTHVDQYAKDAFPTARVYANTPGPELRLITCAGDLEPESGDYSDNVVVYARLLPG